MISLYLKKNNNKYRSWANMLIHSIKMTIHLLLKKAKKKKRKKKERKEKRKKKEKDDYSYATKLLHILNHLNCYPYNMSYYL